MVNRSFFSRWETSHKLTENTLLAFPEDLLATEIISGLRTPGEMYCHIYAHVNAILDACLCHELKAAQLGHLPQEVDCGDREALLRYGRVTMNKLFAHAGQSQRLWERTITVPGGKIVMESLCKGAYDHEVHHRGQMAAMLKHLKVQVPATYAE